MRLIHLATLTHLHLLLNHFPTIGFSIGLGLFIVDCIVWAHGGRIEWSSVLPAVYG